MTVRVGVDAGGTFTDVCLITSEGRLEVYKLASSPSDPSDAIGRGVDSILAEGSYQSSDVEYLGHGTTVATNALLQTRGVKTGVLTTAGFRDLLELGRQQRPDLYDLQVDKPDVLVPRHLRLEVPERALATGEIRTPLDRDAVREAVRALRNAEVESIAVCLLYSYLNPVHEDAIGQIIAEEFPDAYLSMSHDVLAEFREYERLSTTVVNSFVGPIMSRYIRRLRDRFEQAGIPVEPYITQSNGGIISLDVASETPVRTVLSGPAAGVVGAIDVARKAGFPNLITFDMGGTSTDVALINDGEPSMKLDQTVAGHPIRTPMLDINTVGAGGGSIAWIDSGGHLKVGPQSAGAVPGPACYDQDGEEATVTDANVHLGVLSRDALLGGRMPIDATRSDAAIKTLAERLGLGTEQVAQGMLDLATVNMARAIRVISVERGYDPRDYALVAFGGAGPLHAGRLARELEIPRIMVPAIPGILCAYGLLVADLRTDFSRTQVIPVTDESLEIINSSYSALEQEASTWFDREQLTGNERHTRRIADMRYVGQNYELPVPVPDGEVTGETLADLRLAFHQAHEQAYGYAADDEPIQLVTFRLEAFGVVSPPELDTLAAGENLADALTDNRHVWMPEAGGWGNVPLYDRTKLGAGMVLQGPAIVEQMDSTTVILPDQRATVDRYGNLIIEEIGKGQVSA
ncbi:MAG: hydantoinase/oxoprolinase family protein [Sphaerobacteraceae bacterium]|nr:MAG: hydantoinase/oxoprolinase family protein [Sphaerobacteraceae bacterium]